MDEIRVFVGCAPNREDAESQAVLEYTIQKHCSMPVNLTWMKLSRDPSSPFAGWDTSKWATPFTGFRWAVPELCGFEGRAIYCDSDFIFMDDVAKLWNVSFPSNKIILSKTLTRLCFMLWDCEGAKRYLPSLAQIKQDPRCHPKFASLVRNKGLIEPCLDRWNVLDLEKFDDPEDPEIGAIHYTSMPHQPHLPYALQRLRREGLKHWFDGKVTPHWRPELQQLFDRLLREAIREGYTVERYCRDPLYGDYKKASVSSLQGKVPGWGR